jgi:uncharacterized membrane protein
MIYLLLLLIGVAAGLRAATPLAAISIGAWLGWIDLGTTWAGFLGSIIAVVILVILAVLELIGDQLPNTPSRKTPAPFTARVVAGAIAGVLLGLPSGSWIAGLVLGAIGGALGTLGGFAARRWMAARFGRDLPAALIEDAVTIVLALVVVYAA